MAVLHLELLGDFRITSSSGSLIVISAKKSQALFAYLVVKPAQRVSRDKIAGLLWSSTGPEQARQSLRQLLSTLRKELAHISPNERLLIEEGDFLGIDGSAVETDVVTFEALIASGTDEALERATALYGGDFLEGFELGEEKFDQWVLGERDRLHRVALKAHAMLMEQQARRGSLDEAIGTAQASLRIDPLQEPVHRMLMRLYTQSGDLVNALQQYETCARLLKRELRIEPDSETKAIHQQIAQLRAKRGTQPAADAATASSNERKTVLIVEDNQLNRELTNALLKSAGYTVLVAKDGAEALMLLGRERVDLLLLDIDLPFINGDIVLEALKEKGVEVPAIFISGLPGEEHEVRAFEIGAADFIRKPVKNNVLLARVARVLKEEQ